MIHKCACGGELQERDDGKSWDCLSCGREYVLCAVDTLLVTIEEMRTLIGGLK